jgi:protoporphyrinogen oxidase
MTCAFTMFINPAQAVDPGIIARSETDGFRIVHTALEGHRTEHAELLNDGGNATQWEKAILAAQVEKIITQVKADVSTHLGASGLIP